MKTTISVLMFALAIGAIGAANPANAMDELAKKSGCNACHTDDTKLVGPAYKDVAEKYAKDKDAVKKLTEKVRKGSMGVWGPIPMPANPAVSDKDLDAIVKSILNLDNYKKK